MKLAYTLVYVPDVQAAVGFYETAFDLERRFVHESGQYAEMQTGAVTLAFATEQMAELADLAIRPIRPNDVAPGVEIAFVADHPADSYERALRAGARPVKSPEMKPWGQTVGYVRDLNGLLVEICSAMS